MDDVTRQLLQLVASEPRNVAARLALALGVSRQAASARLLRAVKAGLIGRTGHGAGVRYSLATQTEVRQSFAREGLSEDRVWQQLLAPVVADLPEKVRDVWRYGATEMVNNAVDHSGSPQVHVGMRRNALFTQAWVTDDGEGIFLRIQRALDLFDPREAILELAKGKFTTDPANHSGEGIFFSSKVFDVFDIRSGRLHFAHDEGKVDVLFERDAAAPGTTVFMQLANDSPRTTREVFDKFAAPEDYSFAKTIVPVKLAQHEGEKLVSRSQAKRLTMRFERFQTVVLDYAGVEEIGQAFADEVFRVFQVAHPQTTLVPVNMAPGVKTMVSRARAQRRVG
jgi:DNA-binding Lrp family transcriptional regulator